MRAAGRRRRAALAALLAGLAVALTGPTSGLAEDPPAAVDGGLGSLPLDPGQLVAPALTDVERLAALRPEANGIRVALISSGVDTSVLPESLRGQVSEITGVTGDRVGFGTYAASVLLQLDSGARISSLNVYPYGWFHPDWQAGVFNWLIQNPGSFDVVLYALPPSDFMDPVSLYMGAGAWNTLGDAILDRGLPGAKGQVFGAPFSGWLRHQVTAGNAHGPYIDWFMIHTGRWLQARAQIQALRDRGLGVVAPAGDLGPGPQTAFGIANLPEVVTAGGFDGEGVSRTSGSGPSIDGHVKPDLVAPTGLVSLLPPASPVARVLAARKLLDPSLQPAWDAGEPATSARAQLDSTLTSAAVVAAAMGGLSAQGIRDVERQRGALTAAARPLDGVPVWRQGAGVMHRAPSAELASSRPLVLDHGDLGAEPASGEWSTTVALTEGTPASAQVRLTDFMGVGPDAESVTRNLAAGEGPAVLAQPGDGAVTLSAPLGDPSEGGLYCGYTDVAIPGTDGQVENVPTCLVHGTKLRAHGFYIHDLPAKDLTFALLPGLPPGASLLEHPLHMLPINPLDTQLYFRVTGEDGNAYFPNIPPGYYRVRQFSDYGTPVEQTVASSGTGAPVKQGTDIGSPVGYQSFDALILSAVCEEAIAEVADDAGEPRPCTERFLKDRFGEGNVSPDKPTGGWFVETPAGKVRVVFEFLKKMPGANVSSRYIDLLRASDFRFTGVQVKGEQLSPEQLARANGAGALWEPVAGVADPAEISATSGPSAFDAANGTEVAAGVASYPFKLTTPNYKAHFSLNLSYEVTNAFVVPVVVVGSSVGWGVIAPWGTIQPPSVNGSKPLDLGRYTIGGHAEGRVNFDWHLLPRGASQGTLYLVYVPQYVSGANTQVSSATVGDVGFELDTWTNALWPAHFFADAQKQGHIFSVSSNYSTRQMNHPECRAIDNGTVKADVCEDWEVIVHSPGDDAATFDVVDAQGSAIDDIRSAGGGFFDPHRGTRIFHHLLAFGGNSVLPLELPRNEMRVNGQFWEQLAVPEGALAKHPGELQFRIVDNEVGRQSTLLPHADGSVPVAPFVPFGGQNAFLKVDPVSTPNPPSAPAPPSAPSVPSPPSLP